MKAELESSFVALPGATFPSRLQKFVGPIAAISVALSLACESSSDTETQNLSIEALESTNLSQKPSDDTEQGYNELTEILRTCSNNLKAFCDLSKAMQQDPYKFDMYAWKTLDSLIPEVVSSVETLMSRFPAADGWTSLDISLTVLRVLPEIEPTSGLAVDIRCSLQVALVEAIEPWAVSFQSIVDKEDLRFSKLSDYGRRLDSSYAVLSGELPYVGSRQNGWVFANWVKECPEEADRFRGVLTGLSQLLQEISADSTANGHYELDKKQVLSTVTDALSMIDSVRASI